MKDIKTWKQGFFVDGPRYKNWSGEEKYKADLQEKLRVRPAPTENAICQCNNPEDAKWIASRLNLASELEQLTYDFVMGKPCGEKLFKFVRKNCTP